MTHLLFSIFILLFLYSDSSAQKDSLQREINEQVWKAFIKSFEKNYASLFASSIISRPSIIFFS